jgi:hypothetical protein
MVGDEVKKHECFDVLDLLDNWWRANSEVFNAKDEEMWRSLNSRAPRSRATAPVASVDPKASAVHGGRSRSPRRAR